MRRLALLLPALLVGCADPSPGDTPAGALAVAEAYAPPAPGGGTTALFATVRAGAEADTLLGAAFAGAARVELHESTEGADGMRGMREVAAVAVPAGGLLELRPGGHHVMLVGLDRDALAGDTLRATLRFARAGEVPVEAVVRGLDAMHAH